MKKTVSLLLAVLLAAVAVCTFAIGAFAAPDNDDPVDERETTSTTVAETSSTKAEETSSTTKAEETSSTAKEDDSTTVTATVTSTTPDVTKTMAVSQTNYIDPDENSTKATTKKPATVDTTIPSTGSSVVVPAVALLALAAGVTAVVKTKKDN